MPELLWGLLTVVAVLAAFVLLLLATPVVINVTMRTSPKWRLRIAARLLGGLAPSIPIHDSDRSRSKKIAQSRPARKKKAASSPGFGSARAGRMISAAPDLLVGLLRTIRLRYLKVDADIGLADPADTGQVFGLLAPVIHSRRAADRVRIAVRPDFTAARLSGEAAAGLSVVPAALMLPAIRFGWRVFGPRS